MRVLARSGTRVDQDAASLGRTLSLHSSTQLEANDQQPDNEQDIKVLYQRVKRLLYRLERTGPAIGQQEISRVRRALKARFQIREHIGVTASSPFALSVKAMDDEHLTSFSSQQLETLLAVCGKQAIFTVRQRVYMRETPSFVLPEPALELPHSQFEASMLVGFLGRCLSHEALTLIALFKTPDTVTLFRALIWSLKAISGCW